MGFSKKTGKGRLDKYYYLAKEKGYRARSAFKIKQLDQKFNFLSKARVLIDLCAAPGGWLQVASESMPLSHVIVGVDLDPIRPIKGVTTIVGDITTEKCRSELRKELKNWKADVVLHDGAPNVGRTWIQDAFSQAELTLHSFKLASEFLNDGGVFVTKVFRSKEYPLVLSALKKYFKKVEATKPDSSRTVSAEIFVYCKGFNSSQVKQEPIDIRDILTGNIENRPNALTNIMHPEKKRVNRDGYEDNCTILHKHTSLTDYLNSREPDVVLASTNEIIVSTEDENLLIDSFKNSKEIRILLKDLKVLGRKEFKILLKVHKQFVSNLKKEAAKKKAEEKACGDVQDTEAEKDYEVELFDEIKSQQRFAKKKAKKMAMAHKSSENHIDISYEQSLGDQEVELEPEPKEIQNDALSDSEWFSNPIFGEVLQEFTKDEEDNQKSTSVSTNLKKPQPFSDIDEEDEKVNSLPSVDPDDLIDMSFNRYSFNDDKERLPKWFLEDEDKHNNPQEPITKEMVELLKENERQIKNRLPKKVLEAKGRQKMKAFRKLQTIKKKAAVIAENEEMGDGHKLMQIRKLLSKAKVERSKPKLVVAKGKLKALKGRPNGIKGRYKMVDSRMLKDLRAAKRKSKSK